MKIRTALTISAAIAALCATANAGTKPRSGASKPRYGFVKIRTGFPEALYVTSAPNDASTLYVVEQRGLIVTTRAGKAVRTFLDIRSHVLDDQLERGLLGFAFSPNYAQDHAFYVDYVASDGNTHVSRFIVDQGIAVPSSERTLLVVQQPFPNHKGGMLAFDKLGRLWVGLGDGGTDPNAHHGDEANRAQNVNIYLGKLLRIDPDIPGAQWQVAALGLRNPYRFSFDRTTGDLWLADPGTDLYDEIDFLSTSQLDTLPNFGWSRLEGPVVYNEDIPITTGQLTPPFYALKWGVNGKCVIIGGYVYRGARVPPARGRYFFGDYCNGRVWSLKRDASGRPGDMRISDSFVNGITSFGEDANGELYAVSQQGGLYQLRRTS